MTRDGRSHIGRRVAVCSAVVTCLAIALFASFFLLWAHRIDNGPDPLANIFIYDRTGGLLRQVAPEETGYRVWTPLKDVPDRVVDRLLATEDRRFHYHFGIDPVAIARAFVRNAGRGYMREGGSTITQQLAKLMIEHQSGRRSARNIPQKIGEAMLALYLECAHSKDEILERYINSVYIGGRVHGIGTAARMHFGRGLSELTDEEVAMMVGYIRRPLFRRPQYLPPSAAPHFAQFVLNETAPRTDMLIDSGAHEVAIETTLDSGIDSAAQSILKRRFSSMGIRDACLQGAVVISDVHSGDILAMVGSVDHDDLGNSGKTNHATAVRQPGSALKPFTYFLAFTAGSDPGRLVSDTPYNFLMSDERTYTPRNFDDRYHGVLSIREALANSYNVPAVLMLEEMGVPAYLELLKMFGFGSLDRSPEHYGLSLTLGSGGVTLLELTNAYATLARGGRFVEPKTVRKITVVKNDGSEDVIREAQGAFAEMPVRAQNAAFLVTNILTDPDARLRAFGDNENMVFEGADVAVKTGTSHSYRDNWAAGYTTSHALGVWVGRSDNSPLPQLTGAMTAVPVWHDTMALLMKRGIPADFTPPEGVERTAVCADADCRVVKSEWRGRKIGEREDAPAPRLPEESFRIVSPKPFDDLVIEESRPLKNQQIFFKAHVPLKLSRQLTASENEIRWYIDNDEKGRSPLDRPEMFLELAPGRHTVHAVVGNTATRKIPFDVQSTSEEVFDVE